MIPAEWLDQAAARLHGRITQTPIKYDQERNLYLKLENRQITGSFKVRGAFNKILSLQSWELARGLVTASAGNHGQGVALAAQEVGAHVIVFASDHAVPAKVEAMRSLKAEVRLVPGGYAEAEQAGIEFARRHSMTWISPYNDGQIIAGQGTLGFEILEQLPNGEAAVCIVPAGGGGLAAGIGSAFAAARERGLNPPRLVAVQSEASAFLHALYHTGSQAGVIERDSLADGLAGAVEEQAITIPLVHELVDAFVLVTEMEISRAIVDAWQRYGEKIEGSAAVTLAAALSGKIEERPAVLIFSGGNIQPEIHFQLSGQN